MNNEAHILVYYNKILDHIHTECLYENKLFMYLLKCTRMS